MELQAGRSEFLRSLCPNGAEEDLAQIFPESLAATVDLAVLLSEREIRWGGTWWERLPAAIGWREAGRSALQRRIVAALIVESEARSLGEVLVESLEVNPVIQRR
jgi:hypothetical protein